MLKSGGPGPGETRNLIMAMVLSLVVLVGFQFFVAGPEQERLAAQRAVLEAQQAEQHTAAPEDAPSAPVTRESALAASAPSRVVIDTASVDGSLLLEGARLDDLNLRGYHRTIDENSPEVTLLSPNGAEHGHDAFFGWEARQNEQVSTLADSRSPWSAAEGARLGAGAPVTLTLALDNGLSIERTISVDADYMFTVTDVVRNDTGAAQDLRPFGAVRRQGLPQDFKPQPIVHQGMTGVFGPTLTLHETKFQDAEKHAKDKARGRAGEDERIVQEQGRGGWFGVTDHYWLTAIIPPQDEQVSAYYDSRQEDAFTDFRAAYRGSWRTVAPGESVTYTQHLFAGAKRVDLLRRYQDELGVPDFDQAVDWGIFWFLTRPFFAMLDFFAQWFGGMGIVAKFGLAILASTVVIKLVLFPLIYSSYKAMAKLRQVQPKMKEIQERFAADKQRQQQEMIRLYQTEKINPVSGCLPMLLQIPVFYALYKVLSVTIEMRHAPFYGWIHDLSAPDPTSIFNLFGILPAIGFDFHAIPFIGLIPAIGVLPILYGASMWALQALSPPPPDPIQAQIFKLLPLVFTFMFASFAAGMVIYWVWSNVLSLAQQYLIMRRQGVETELDKFIAKRLGKAAPSAAE